MKEISFQNDILPLKNKLFRLALRITLNREEAEDVVQDTLMKVWNNRDKWQQLDSIEAYSLAIARNLSLDRNKRMDNTNTSLDEDSAHDEQRDQAYTPSERIIQKDRLNIVRRMIDRLPEKQRSCLQLRDIEGKTYKDIAAILNITEEQVKVNIFRPDKASNNDFKNTTDMDYKYIDQLLERYWKCETSLEEEDILRTFFSQEVIPAQLEKYKTLFAYEQETAKNDVLSEDFDRKMMAMIASTDEEKEAVSTKAISLTDRLKPLFKAAAIVAIFLTLGNAAQVPFQDDAPQSATQTGTVPAKGRSVAAMNGDSLSMDSTQHTSINQMPTEPAPVLYKR